MPKWRRPSVFGPGRRVPLDRNRLARFVWLVRNDRRHGRLSATGEDVALELVKMLGEDGRLDPSHATITARVGCDISTTRRCLKRLKSLGRIDWECRLRRDSGTGWRAEQTSNAYVICPDACDTHSAHPVSTRVSKKPAAFRARGETDRESAARQLRALGYEPPAAWGLAAREAGHGGGEIVGTGPV